MNKWLVTVRSPLAAEVPTTPLLLGSARAGRSGAEGFSDAPALAALGRAGRQQSNIAIADLDLTGAVQHCSTFILSDFDLTKLRPPLCLHVNDSDKSNKICKDACSRKGQFDAYLVV